MDLILIFNPDIKMSGTEFGVLLRNKFNSFILEDYS
jgi:hypothetical protein